MPDARPADAAERRPHSFSGDFTREGQCIMDWRNRIGLYGSYFFGVAGIGFTLPFLPLYLGSGGCPTRRSG